MDNRKLLANAAATPPTAPASPSVGYPTNGNPGTGTPAGTGGAFWFHSIAEEVRNIILGGGLTPSEASLDQAKQAIFTRYGFSAHRNGVDGASSASGVVAKINFNAEDFDPQGVYDSTTNFRFNCPLAGLWMFGLSIQATTSASTIQVPIIYKNGVEYKRGGVYEAAGTAGFPVTQIVMIADLAVNDTIEFYQLWVGATLTLSGLKTTSYAWGYKL